MLNDNNGVYYTVVSPNTIAITMHGQKVYTTWDMNLKTPVGDYVI